MADNETEDLMLTTAQLASLKNAGLTEEQVNILQEYLYKYKNRGADDYAQFVIPFIAMNDGHTPAQIKATSKGLYKDVQRNPFLRKSGVFSQDGTIEDIDITPLVYYGTLQQAKIAPTLENIDVKLYYKEPALTKVPSTTPDGIPADTYIWRELPVGFHVYNNDTVYGYEWLVLQNDYADTDGIYNLHMNIEDGLGVCKFAGTQAPINLAGVQYKIIITAKNLWNREFSLIDSMPLLHNLNSNSDSLAPTVNAVKEYYANCVETLRAVAKELFVADAANPVLFADKDGVIISKLEIGDIENLEEYVTTLNDDYYDHENFGIENAARDEQNRLVGPHGIKNTGATGNINANVVAGLGLSNGQQAVSENITSGFAYIPYVGSDDAIGLGTVLKFYKHGANETPVPVYKRTFEALTNKNILNIADVVMDSSLSEVLYSLSVGTTSFNASIAKDDSGEIVLKLSKGNEQSNDVHLKTKKISTDSINVGNATIDETAVNYWNGASTIAYKLPISELLGIKIKDFRNGAGSILVPNRDTDADGFPVEALNTESLEGHDLKLAAKEFTEDGFNSPEAVEAFDKLGSALQALYELPLGTYEYKRGQAEYKEQIGIFVERVNQFRDNLLEIRGEIAEDARGMPTSNNLLVHKRNTLLRSAHSNVIDADKGCGVESNVTDQGSDFTERVNNNAYTYTDEEVKSIAHYFDILTGKKELSQEIRNTVGVLLKAAKETQERLLDIETAVYGFDALTLPGTDESKQTFVNEHIAEDLQAVLNNSPLLLGLNRLMRAVCLELYDTTDLESIDAEIRSVVKDSDSLASKVTVKSRMDSIDDILSDLMNQASALSKYYIENITNDESAHTYTELYDAEDANPRVLESNHEIIDETKASTEVESLLANLKDDHSDTSDVDHGRAWKTLPSTDDLTDEAKSSVAFAEVAASAYKHTPTKEESGIVRVPRTETTEHDDYDKDGNKHTRTWNGFVVEKDEETGSYHPVYDTKAVAWDTAKLERINKKLSEVTKTIYGTDDVTASLPNRTEVLRRNITNLIDDLYPNRNFDVEKVLNNPYADSDIRVPFKKSNTQNVAEGEIRAANVDEPAETEEHVSIITHIDNELFNFKLESSIFKGAATDGISPKTEAFLKDPYSENTQVAISNGDIVFDSSKLMTDLDIPKNFGTYFKAFSRLDYIEDVLGLKNTYSTKLFATSIIDAVGIDLDSSDASVLNDPVGNVTVDTLDVPRAADKTLLNNYLLEIAYSEATSIENTAINPQMALATNCGYVLTRKIKPIQDRVSTLESFADEVSKGLEIVSKRLGNTNYNSENTEDKHNNKRFETQNVVTVLDNLASAVNGQKREALVYDLDLSESFKLKDASTGLFADCTEHNRDLWRIVQNSKDVTKSVYNITSTSTGTFTGYYTLEGVLATEVDVLNLTDTNLKGIYKLGDKWTIKVAYIASSATNYNTATLDGSDYNHLICLGSKGTVTGTQLAEFYKEDIVASDVLTNSGGWQNQTEYNIYKTMNNLFKQMLNRPSGKPSSINGPLYYQAMLMAHPVGSIYIAKNSSTTPSDLFGGTWSPLDSNTLLQVVAWSSVAGDSKGTQDVNVTVGGDGFHNHEYIDTVPVSFESGGAASILGKISVSSDETTKVTLSEDGTGGRHGHTASGTVATSRINAWLRTGA